MYNYLESMKADILAYGITEEIKAELMEDRDEVEQKLNDDLWCDDSITGNASCSYFCNSYKAKEAVTDNEELCREALREFCTEPEQIAEHFLNGDWEYFDVTIRCYLLGQAISEALDEIEEEQQTDTIPDEFIETVSRDGSGSIAG